MKIKQLRIKYFLILIILICLNPLGLFHLNGQQQIENLEKQLNQLHGKERLAALHEITDYYLNAGDFKKALRFARQAERLSENVVQKENTELTEEEFELKPMTFIRLGKAYELTGQLMESKSAYLDAIESSEEFEAPGIAVEASARIRAIDSLRILMPKEKKPFLGKTLRDIGNVIDKTTNEFGITASLKLAKVYADKEDYEKSIHQYQIAKNILQDMGSFDKIEEVEEWIAEIESEMESLSEAERTEAGTINTDSEVGQVKQIDRVPSETILTTPESRAVPSIPNPATSQGSATVSSSDPDQIRRAAQKAESRRNYSESIDYYKQYITRQEELQSEVANQQLALLEQANELENRDREILLLKQNDQIQELELKRQETELLRKKATNKNLAIGTGLLGAVLLSLYFLYFNKQRAHQKLSTAYTKLETTQNQLKTAQSKIKSLLHQQVSGAVADELLASTGNEPIARKFVCIMFLDIRDFTVFAEELNPEEIIEYQNKVFGFMIETVNKHHGIVNQILGDGFMATFGAPATSGHDCQDAYLAAREIIDIVDKKSSTGEIPPTKVGIGLHAGYVVTGNVGTSSRKQYSITGNPVIIASRLEQLNKTFGSSIVISKDVYDQLPEAEQSPMDFSEVTVKGRSKPVAVAAI